MTIVIDTREQTPWRFSEFETMPGTLPTGDYSIQGHLDRVAIERKSLSDFIGCVGRERERFERELLRLRSYKCRAVIIESDMDDIVQGNYRSRVNPNAAVGSMASWQTRYNIPFVLVGEHGEKYVISMFRCYLKRFNEQMASALAEQGPIA